MISLMVLTWVRGSRSLVKATRKNEAELEWLVRKLDAKPPHRVPGTAVFLTGDPNSAPTSLMHNLKHNRVLHERNIILTIKTEDTPRVPRHERIADRARRRHLHSRGRALRLHGDAERAEDPRALPAQGPQYRHRGDLVLPVAALAQDHLKSEMPRWQERLFIWLAGRAEDATEYFRIPSDRVVEVGTQVMV